MQPPRRRRRPLQLKRTGIRAAQRQPSHRPTARPRHPIRAHRPARVFGKPRGRGARHRTGRCLRRGRRASHRAEPDAVFGHHLKHIRGAVGQPRKRRVPRRRAPRHRRPTHSLRKRLRRRIRPHLIARNRRIPIRRRRLPTQGHLPGTRRSGQRLRRTRRTDHRRAGRLLRVPGCVRVLPIPVANRRPQVIAHVRRPRRIAR